MIVTSIKATDVHEDALAAQDMKEYKKARDWQLDSQITQNSQVTWEWMLINRPEVAQQLISTYGSLAKEMIERGAIDSSGLLNQSNNIGQFNWQVLVFQILIKIVRRIHWVRINPIYNLPVIPKMFMQE